MLNLDMYVWIMRAEIMSVTDDILKTDYSLQFDEKRKALVVQSHYKYGRAGIVGMSVNEMEKYR